MGVGVGDGMEPDRILTRLRELIEDGSLPIDDMGYCIDCREDIPREKSRIPEFHADDCCFMAIMKIQVI